MKNIFDEVKKLAGELNGNFLLKDILSSLSSDKLRKIRPDALAMLVEAAHFLSDEHETGESYKPAEDYAGLIKQFNAVINLNRSLRQQVSFYRRNIGNEKTNFEEIALLHEQVNSERAANERLTEEINELNNTLLARDERLAALEVHDIAQNHAKKSFPSQHDEAVRRADDAEIQLEQERKKNAALKKQIERLALVEHLTKSTARVLGIQNVDDPLVAQDVLSHTSSLIWNFEQLIRELKAGTHLPEPLYSARILALPESRLSKESIELVVHVAGQMLVHLSQAESQRGAGHENDWLADNWQSACISGLNRHISKNNPVDAMNYIAFAIYHGWPINQQS
ncbi:hypothetical protein J7S78_13950 [Klebsiella oxytoca]|uniref:Uncharacterized protein n=1 Tax=Klebsiella oxytoca TaxID=571 RepID=A0AAP2FLN4_KLEOX|nr:hypothetical protein [Klebsiella oxytoca]MBQ0600897.1 hypothetical protein [Klebsiella oxytoca]